jgi:hypothetical protein
MTVLFKSAEWEQVTASATSQYSCPSNAKSAIIVFANCTNEDATGTTLTLHIVASGGSALDTNKYIEEKTLTAGETSSLSEVVGAVLEPGDAIHALAADASRLNLKISIKEIY